MMRAVFHRLRLAPKDTHRKNLLKIERIMAVILFNSNHSKRDIHRTTRTLVFLLCLVSSAAAFD